MNIRSLPNYFKNSNFPNQDNKGYNLRKYCPILDNAYKLHIHKQNFSILTQNMALMVAPASYKGANTREDCIAEIIFQIKMLLPDVVGLCEVFKNDEREFIWNSLKQLYPFAQGGPDEFSFDSDGGLLLLSRHQFLQTEQIVYEDSRGADSLANKGIIYVRIHPAGLLNPIDLFYTHMQDLEASTIDTWGVSVIENWPTEFSSNKTVLFSQLGQLKDLIEKKNIITIPTFIFGDLNVPGDNINLLNEMLNALDNPVDLWMLAGNSHDSGCTNIRDNNFYEDGDDKPEKDHRLDFILMRTSIYFIPILKDINVMKFMKNNRNLSDHFGLHARFEEFLQVDSF